MSSRARNHVRSNVVGYIAIFMFAIGGTAFAVDGPLPGMDQVGSEDIINGEVYSTDLRNNQVTAADVRDDSLTGGGLGGVDIANQSLTGQDVTDDSIDSSDVTGISGPDVADGGLTGADVLNQSLTGSDIQDNSVNADDVFGLRGDDDIENGSLTGSDIQDNTVNADDVFGLRGDDDIENGSLTGADVANGSLTGTDIADANGADNVNAAWLGGLSRANYTQGNNTFVASNGHLEPCDANWRSLLAIQGVLVVQTLCPNPATVRIRVYRWGAPAGAGVPGDIVLMFDKGDDNPVEDTLLSGSESWTDSAGTASNDHWTIDFVRRTGTSIVEQGTISLAVEEDAHVTFLPDTPGYLAWATATWAQ